MKSTKKILLGTLTLVTLTGSTLTLAGNQQIAAQDNTMQGSVQKASKYISDSAITAKVKAEYVKSPILSALDINVTTKKGVVYLSGEVESDTQYAEAITRAESVEGVKDVRVNKLAVAESKQPLKDTYITAKVKGKLIQHKIIGDNVAVSSVSVETKNGTVYLSGTVQDDSQLKTMLNLVRSVEGVKSVRSSLKTRG